MKVALNRTQGRAANDGGLFGRTISGLVDAPEAQPLIRRLGEQVCPFSPIDRHAHVLMVAQVALHAKRHPNNAYARPTA